MLFWLIVLYVSASELSLDCPSSLCPDYYIGDGYCDENCMIPNCNYDSTADSSEKVKVVEDSDCFADCQMLCPSFLLGDGSCNPECNVAVCAWDLGDCGYCAQRCFQEDLELEECKSECRTLACRFGLNSCGWCAESCYYEDLDDGECQEACKVADCEFDGEDCANCSEGCKWDMLGDGYCDTDCYNEACDKDLGDCECADGCTPDKLTSSTCQSECNNHDCSWQNGVCGDCASDCFVDMIDNGNCEEVCNTETCDYDGRDCGCAPGCLTRDLGSCKPECLVADCDYDPTCSGPVADFDKLSAIVYHLLTDDYTGVYHFDEQCAGEETGCSQTDLAAGFNEICHPDKCMKDQCLHQLGGCSFDESTKCPPRCKRCSNVDSSFCFECEPGDYNQSGTCKTHCDLGYRELEDCHLCVPEIDESSEANPVIYRVSLRPEPDEYGTLEEVIKIIWNSYVTILLSLETHEFYDFNLEESHEIEGVHLTIKADCDPCTEYAVISLRDSISQFRDLYASLTFENINVDGSKAINSACKAETCRYCPYFYEFGQDVFYDDRDELIDSPGEYNTDYCPVKESNAFIEGSFDVTMTNCLVSDYRRGSNNFIDMDGGILTLTNVDFVSIEATQMGEEGPGSAAAAVITYDCIGEECDDTSVVYTGGTVSYLNNGYEYREDISQFGFMSISRANEVRIENILFDYNVILCGLESESCGNLLELSNIDLVVIQDCTFNNTFTVQSTIFINQEEFKLHDVTLDSSGNCIECDVTHIQVNDNSFVNVGSNDHILKVIERDFILNVDLSRNEFSDCKSTSVMIAVAGLNGFSDSDLNGGSVVLVLGEDRVVALSAPKVTVLQEMTFSQCFASAFIGIEWLPNITLKDLIIPTTSTDSDLNSVLTQYMADDKTYMSLPIKDLENIELMTYIIIVECTNVAISNINTETITCTQDKCLLLLESLDEDITVSHINVSGVIATGTDAALISLSSANNARASFNDILITNVISSSGIGALSITSVSEVILDSLTFSNIEAYSTAGVVIQQSQQVSAKSLNFTHLQSTGGSGGALYLTFSGTQSANSLVVENSVFTNNSASSKAGVLYLAAESGTQEISVSICNSTFEQNRASTGSVLVVSDAVSLSDDSLIENCTFSVNTAENSGGVVLNQLSGVLHIRHSSFLQNSGKGNSVYGSFSSDGPMLDLTNVTFSQNTGGSALYMVSTLETTSFNSTNCVFTENNPSAVSVLTATWFDEASELSSNVMAFILHITATGYLTDIVISHNVAGSLGSVCQVVSSSYLQCTRCHFLDNSSELNGAALAIESHSSVQLTASEFIRGSTLSKGSAISFNNNGDTSYVSETTFTLNVAEEGGTINIVESSVQFTACEFILNEASVLSAGVMINAGEAFFFSSKFHDQASDHGVFIYATTDSAVTVESCTFDSGVAQSGGMIVLASSELIMLNSSMTSCTSASGSAGIIAFSSSDLTLTSCQFSDISSTDQSRAVYAEGGSFVIADCSFEDLASGGLELSGVHTFSMGSTLMTRLNSSDGAAIYSTDALDFSISGSCEFSDINSEENGAIYLGSSFELKNNYAINASTFSRSSANKGAALHIDGVSVTVSDNSFVSNTAEYAGGAIYSTCPIDRSCSVTISSNVFENNNATFNGGAIAWKVKKPTLIDNTYQANTAPYGNDYASFPALIGQVLEQRRLDESELASGQLISPPIILALYDHYGQIVTTADDYIVQVTAIGSNTSVAGETQVTSVAGIFEFASLNVTAEPKTNLSLSFYSSSLEALESSNLDAPIESTAAFSYYSRACETGEYFFNYECIICEEGQYSLDPLEPCADCPKGGKCYGHFYMAPEAGYWRDNEFTDQFYACYNSAACLGGVTDDLSEYKPTGECNEGYRGRLCQPCDNGYSVTSKYQCGKCPADYVNALRLLGIGGLVVVVCFVMVRSSLRSAYQPKALHSVYIKILVNYLQLVMLTAQFRLDWPQAVLELLTVQEQAGQVTDQLFSVDCYLASDNEESYKAVLYAKLIIMTFLPCVLVAAAFAFWGIFACCKKDKSVLKKELITTLCVLFFLIHPTLTRLMFAMFSCIEIEGESWLLENLDIECWSEEHLYYSLLVALPSIIVWVIGVPTLILVVISRRKRLLMTTNERLRFGFLYNGYKLNTYYWEFVILYRKIALICCAVFLSAVSIPIQALICFSVLLTCLHMQYTVKPFNRKELNQMEVRAIIVACITIYCGLYYLTNDLSEFGKYLFFALILTVNVYFLVFWLYYFCHAALVLASRFVPFLRDKVKEVQFEDKPLLSLMKTQPGINPKAAKKLLQNIQSAEDFYSQMLTARLQANDTQLEDSEFTFRSSSDDDPYSPQSATFAEEPEQ